MRRPKLKSIDQLEAECIVWNHKNPKGTPVHFFPVIGGEKFRVTETISAAWVLSGHTAVVQLRGVSGCVALDACSVVWLGRRIRTKVPDMNEV